MRRSLKICRNILLGRPISDTRFNRYQRWLVGKMSHQDIEVMKSFTDDEWRMMQIFVKTKAPEFWFCEEIALPVDL